LISSHAKLSVFRPWMNYHSTKRHSSISRVGLLAYGQYVYKVEYDTTGTELERLAQVYNSLRETVIAKYSETDIGRTFLRVFDEHFTIVEEWVAVKPPEELSSGCLQSPDDKDVTYRKKRGEGYRGHIARAMETRNPANSVQLHHGCSCRDEQLGR